MVGVLALVTLVLPLVRRPLRVWLIVFGAVVVLAIGLGRVVLNVHHPSDVVAGWALGYVWFVVCAAAGVARCADHGSGRNTGSAR